MRSLALLFTAATLLPAAKLKPQTLKEFEAYMQVANQQMQERSTAEKMLWVASDPARMSQAAVGKLLGPRWKLVETRTYRWHYEWRFNFFHTWRTRVWVPAAGEKGP